ncbi:S41 family peptidase [Corynebacterium sp. NPDC060344]|uniref:S41 family peptidase n=1 Tax=Corynebacterium sp. NPDC060344 TaxID=3347101 RepID=UPI003661C539
MKTSTKLLSWFGGVIAALLIVALAAVHFFGPSVGAMVVGKPIFLVPPSPSRYANVALDIMQEQGIYGDSPEFAAARAEAERMLDGADLRDYADTWPALDLAIDAAGGKHSKVLRPEGDGQGTGDDAGDEAGSDAAPAVTSEDTAAGGRVLTATVPAHGGDSGGPESQRYADTLAAGIAGETRAGACGAIVDLRGNGGGDMGPMVAGLSALLPDGDVLWFDGRGGSSAVSLHGGSLSGGGSPITVDAGPKADVPVAVLVDGGTASSGEATMLAFRGLENSASFGAPTAGYASANTVIGMPGGMKLMLTVAKDRDRTGDVHMDEPIRPDHSTDNSTDSVTGSSTDSATDAASSGDAADAKTAALEWLSTRGCG